MTDIAISVQNLSKCYQIYENPRDRLKQFVAPRLQRMAGQMPKQYFREFWALKGVSFEIKKGETVGIIGRNGSGKSTLLQMICGTLNPTSGSVQTNGRIAALLELGSGFNPEFTGRENVYMNAAVLGLTKDEVDTRFDDIAAFADIGQFIEQPVKTYSSGMVVRLAFAVAINVDPEILIVDEALSVGDELFQRKCFSRIETIRANGATILFVSHSGGQIVELCDRAMLMDAGEKITIGAPKKTVGQYQKLLSAPINKRLAVREQISSLQTNRESAVANIEVAISDDSKALLEKESIQESYDPHLKPTSTIAYESLGAQIEHPQVLNLIGERVNNLQRGKTYIYSYKVRFELAANNVRFGMMIKTVSGLELGGGMSAANMANSIYNVPLGSVISVEFKFKCVLNAGVYFMNAGVIGLQNGSEIYLHRLLDIEMFRVMPDTNTISFGTVDFECDPEMNFLS
jgi:lipopolysaccharide transport system ATP-binding protein